MSGRNKFVDKCIENNTLDLLTESDRQNLQYLFGIGVAQFTQEYVKRELDIK